MPHAEEIAIIARMEELLATPERWCKWQYYSYGGAVCLGGAARVAMGSGSPERRPNVARKFEKRVLEAISSNVTLFNDNPRTTHADVLRQLRKARRHFEEAV